MKPRPPRSVVFHPLDSSSSFHFAAAGYRSLSSLSAAAGRSETADRMLASCRLRYTHNNPISTTFEKYFLKKK